MSLRRLIVYCAAVAALFLSVEPAIRAADTLPPRLTDQEFWKLSDSMSEPNGYFQSDNLVSNEDTFQYVVPAIRKNVKPGGVYYRCRARSELHFICIALRSEDGPSTSSTSGAATCTRS